MSVLLRFAGPLICLLLAMGATSAATPKEIDDAIKRGTEALKARYTPRGGGDATFRDAAHGIGPTCMAGIAMLEGGVKVDDPAFKAVANAIRSAAYSQSRTYHTAHS